jgi:DNA-binding NarL/FixJ family response regulator
MPILQPLRPSTVLGEVPEAAPDRPPVRVLLGGDGRASPLDLRRAIAADPALVDIGQAIAPHEALRKAHDLQPDVVVLDCALSHDVVMLASELTSLDRPPAVVVRLACPEPVMTIAAIVAGVRGIVSQSDREGAICDVIRWVAGTSRWFPDTPISALSRAGSRLDREDVPILLMLMRGARAPDIAAGLGISPASLNVRRAAMLGEMLDEPPRACGYRARRAGESAPAASEADERVAIAA